MVQSHRPPPSQAPLLGRIGIVLTAGLLAATALIAGNYEAVGPDLDTTTVTAASLLAPRRPQHNPDPAVISPLRP